MSHSPSRFSRAALILAGSSLLALALSATVDGEAEAASSAAGDEFMANMEAVPPNIVFLLDLSMDDDCESSDTGGGEVSTTDCLSSATSAIKQVVKHYDWANFGVIGTTDDANSNTFYEIAPIGSSASDIDAALDALTATSGVRNLAEALSEFADDYLTNTTTGNSDEWKNAPITYSCQQTHVITVTTATPSYDEKSKGKYTTTSGMDSDVVCDDEYIKDTTDEWCEYDNVVSYLYNKFDARNDLSGDQNVVTHTVGINIDGSSLAEELYGSASNNTNGEGIYIVANNGNEVLAKVLYVLNDIRAGYYSRSAPVITADGSYMIYSFYQIAGLVTDDAGEDSSSVLAQGHVRAYQLDDDPTSATYGQVLYNGSSQFGGALWDAGDLLVSRPAQADEDNPMDQDGFGQRDIFTFVPEVAAAVSSTDAVWAEDSSGVSTDDRMNFDRNFVDAVDSNSLLDTFMDTSNTAYDMDGDNDVDADDLQDLVDFARGVPEQTFRYLEQERGYWKLGDSPHATPAVVTARNNTYTSDATYRRFLKAMEDAQASTPDLYPDIVLLPANDGMLHAFSLEDYLDAPASALGNPDDDQAGEELWAWALSYPLYRYDDGDFDSDDDGSEGWSGRLVDLMLYGRTYIFDGTPVVEDVWIDADGDGAKTCWASTFPDGCEWRRVVVVQQGKGGPSTLALDITVPAEPRFLWEHMNPDYYEARGGVVDSTAMGYSVSRPAVVNLYDRETAHGAVHDRWVAVWGSGRAVPYANSTSYYSKTEPTLYFWHLSDDYNGANLDAVEFSRLGSNGHPESGSVGSLDSDGDGRYEYGYISGAVAAIDHDSDGDVDVLYFPVTASYEPSDLGDPDSDGTTGLSDISDPGSTWMYKAVINTDDLDDPTWCEFVDPYDWGIEDENGNAYRPEVYYAATAAWHSDGTLGIYWGSGSPYDRMGTNPGYFFAFKDLAPLSCPASPEPICGSTGYQQMAAGEGLTGDPIVYSKTVYFPTYTPNTDRCEDGTGRIWGLTFDTCDVGLDTDGDGVADSESTDTEGYPSEVVVTEQGQLLWGTSHVDNAGAVVGSISPVDDPFNGVATLMIREVF
jgi:hypothetical protein